MTLIESTFPQAEEIDPIKELYSEFDFTRPPFEIPEEYWHRIPEYEEIDERDLWRIEGSLFTFDLDQFPLPELPEDHPLVQSKKALIKSQKALEQSMDKVWDSSNSSTILNTKRNRTRTQAQEILKIFPNAIVRSDLPSEQAHSPEQQKSDMYHHYIQKKLYLQHLRSFFELARAYKLEEDSKAFEFNVEFGSEMIDWAEVIQLGHITYALVRSAIQTKKPSNQKDRDKRKRKDGRLTMQHIYSVSVDVINAYKKELATCKDADERRSVFQDMKKAVVIAICHDYKEDYRNLAPYLRQKLNEALTWDTAILARLTGQDYASTEKEPNIMYRGSNGDEIMEGIDALTKPDIDANPTIDLTNYLTRQIGGIESIRFDCVKLCCL